MAVFFAGIAFIALAFLQDFRCLRLIVFKMNVLGYWHWQARASTDLSTCSAPCLETNSTTSTQGINRPEYL